MEPAADEAEPIVSCLTQDLLTDGTLPSYPIAIDLSAPRFQLASVSEGLALARANVLRELHLGGNALTSLDGISRFEALRVLRAPNNRIVDATIRCPRLTLLDLSSNQLGSLPLLQGCAALLMLDVTDNSIRSGLDHLVWVFGMFCAFSFPWLDEKLQLIESLPKPQHLASKVALLA